MSLADADKPILRDLFSYRFLQSGQLGLLRGRSSQVVRRAIRKRLVPGKYVVNMAQRFPTEEAAYTLGPEGFEFIAYEHRCSVSDLPYSKKINRVKSYFWKHTLLTNNVRIAFDLGSRTHERVHLARAVPEWEMDNPASNKKEEKFVLWERLCGEEMNGKPLSFRPDALFLIHPQEQPDYKVAYFLESDRGTEDVAGKIREKFLAYRLYFDQLLFSKRFDARQMRCLFVLEAPTDYRIRTMQRVLADMAGKLDDPQGEGKAGFVKCFRFALVGDISESAVYDEPVWQDWKGEGRALVKSE